MSHLCLGVSVSMRGHSLMLVLLFYHAHLAVLCTPEKTRSFTFGHIYVHCVLHNVSI